MAKFRVVQTSYINERLAEPGEVVEVDTSVMQPGPNLEPVKEAPPAPRAGGKAGD